MSLHALVTPYTKCVKKDQGYVADFCKLCRTVRAFRLQRMVESSYMCFMAYGEETLLGHWIRCTECGCELPCLINQYATVEAQALPVEQLESRTFPNLRAVHAERLALEVQISQGVTSLDPLLRAALITEPFHVLESRAAGRSRFAVNKSAGFGCLAIFLLFPPMIALEEYVKKHPEFPLPQTTVSKVLIGFFLLLLLNTVLQVALGYGRFVKKQLLPSLIKALRPLHPSREELAGVLAECKRSKFAIGRCFNPEQLWTELQRPMRGR